MPFDFVGLALLAINHLTLWGGDQPLILTLWGWDGPF